MNQVTSSADAMSPRYAVIKEYLLGAIRSGELAPGDRLQSESELVTKFSVSRMTANRALRELQNEGIIHRMPGVGSFVAEQQPRGHIIEIRNIADEIRSRGHEYTADVEMCDAERATSATAALLRVPVGTKIFHSMIVHNEAGAPIQLEERFVLASSAPDYGSMDFSKVTPNEYLTRVAPLERVDHTVRAMMPDARTKALLKMRADEPALLLIRQTWSRGKLVSYARLTHPGSKFEFNDTFTVG
ncbi:histidine utilization repressor [Sphingomonas sp. S-NIH.Pt1_0416]|uniref:histidine utilization repressor n=1 Tax=Sphingomonas sp. S-NIH.Pt1_0416 TaxID=1920123 RepID=UPI001F493C17|nr:histidine utilization repressor [Sphingomonas sp. S-NIH.Pt1_0416]